MELRKDYILNEWVIISETRAKRPTQFASEERKEAHDFFAKGNEHETPPEIGRIPGDEGWKMRWFDNKFPFAQLEGQKEVKTDNTYFTYAQPFGKHEVIVETPDADKQLWDLEADDVKNLLDVYAKRTEELMQLDGVKFVQPFKNHGAKGGTSLLHSHSQLAGINIIPPKIQKKVDAIKQFDHDPFEDIINIEKTGPRLVKENDLAIAFCPYASQFPYGVVVFPKTYRRTLSEMSQEERAAMADLIIHILRKLKEMNVSYNLLPQSAPQGEEMRFHIEITPRPNTWAGFELSSGIIVNSTSPESAAKWYRGEE